MKYKVITQEIYDTIENFCYTIEKLKYVSHILSECMIDSDFKQFELESLAVIIYERLKSLYTEICEFIETLEPNTKP